MVLFVKISADTIITTNSFLTDLTNLTTVKIVFTLIFVVCLPLSAADRYFIGPGNWNSTANWSATSGGATGASVPGASDMVYFDANSGNCTINANATCLGINSTGYTNTITQGAYTMTVGASGLNWVSGNFTGSASTITVNSLFSQSGGVFTSTSGTLTMPGSFNLSGGVFNHNNGTVSFTAAATITNGVFYNLTLSINGIITITNNTIVNNTFTISTLLTLNGSAIEAKGNIVFSDTSWNGSSKIIVNGTGTQTFSGTGVCGVTMDVDKSAGVVNLSGNRPFQHATSDLNLINGTFNCVTFTLTVTGKFTQTGGIFHGGTAAISVTGVFTLDAGSFTSTSGVLTLVSTNSIAGGVFSHNNGTVALTAPAVTIVDGNFYNLTFNNSTLVATITNNTVVANTLTFSAIVTLNGSPIEARGNIVFTDTSWNGSSKIIVNGTGTQAFTGAGVCGVSMDVDKASGVVNLGSNRSFQNATTDLNLIAGEFNCATFTLSLPRNLVITGGTFTPGTGTVAFTGAAVNIIDGNFYNLTLNASTQVATITNNTVVANTLTFSAIVTINGSPIEARGNIVFTDTSWNGSSKIIVNGTGTQTFTGAGVCGVSMDVDKASGVVNLGSNRTFQNTTTDLNLIAGDFNCATFTLTLPRNLVITGGAFIPGTGTVAFTGATVNIIDGNFYNLTLNASAQVATITNNTVVANTLTFSAIATLNGSPIEARGNIVFSDTSWNGSSKIIVNGTGTQTFTGAGRCGVTMDVNKASGSVELGANMTFLGSTRDLNLLSGDFNCNNRTLTITRNLVITGGVFNAGTGTVIFTGAAITIDGGDFYNLTFSNSSQVATITNIITVNNTLNIASVATINGSAIEAKGNIAFSDTSRNGTCNIIANGTGDQNISGAGDVDLFEINKTSGNLIFNSSVNINVGKWTHTSGTIIWNGNTVTCNGASATIESGNFYNLTLNSSSLVLSLTNDIVVANTLTLTLMATFNGAKIEVAGDIVFADTAFSGTGTIVANGAGDQNISGVGDVNNFEINKPSGNLIINSNVVINGGAWKHTAGNIVWNDNTVTCNGSPVTLNSGNFFNLIFNSSSMVVTLENSTTVNNTLTLTALATLNGDSIEAKGDIVFTDVAYDGSGVVIANGTANQNISGVGDVNNFEINKSSGDLIFNSSVVINGGGWVYTAGNLVWNNNTVTCNGTPVAINNGRFYQLNLNNASLVLTLTGNTIISNTLTLSALATIDGGSLSAEGDITNTDISWDGTGKLIASGTSDQTVLGAGDLGVFEINKSSGNLNFNANVVVSRGWKHLLGNVNWNNNSVTFNGVAGSIDSGQFNNLIFNNASLVLTLLNNPIVDQTTTFTSLATMNGGSLQSKGNLVFTDVNWDGTGVLTLIGTSSQNISGSGMCGVSLDIKKPDGAITLLSNLTIANTGSDLTIIDGELDLNGFNVTVPDLLTVYDKMRLVGNENINVNGVANSIAITNPNFTISATSSTIEYYNLAVTAVVTNLSPTFYNLTLGADKTHEFSTGVGNGITVYGTFASNGSSSNRSVLRSIGDAASNWELNLVGTSLLGDKVSVKRSDASAGAEVYAFGSLNSGNNTNWVFSGPTITSITSLTPDGSYSEGSEITIQINFSHGITLVGTMGVNLDTGGVAVINAFAGSSATGSYFVGSNQNTSELNAVSVSLTGTARDFALNNLDLSLPPSNIEDTCDIIIDTIAPTITSISSSKPDGSYTVGETINVKIDFSEMVTVTTSLNLTLDSGGLVTIAGFTGTSASGVYTVLAGHNSSDLSVSSISVTGFARDAALNNLSLTLPSNNISTNSNIVIDTTAPTMTSITSTKPNGSYSVGENINVNVSFSEMITVTTSLNITLDTGGLVTINGFSGTSASGVYTVLAGHTSSDLTVSSVSVTGTARDAAQNNLVLTLPVTNIATNSDIVIDTAAPTITSITSNKPDGEYSVGETINVRINFSEAIAVSTSLSINLNTGGVATIAGFTGTTAVGVYTVLAGHNTTALTASSVSVVGTARDAALNNLALTLPSTNIATDSNIVIDTAVPTITAITSSKPNGAYSVGETISVQINFSESITVTTALNITLDTGGVVAIGGFTGTSAVGTYTVLAGHNSLDLNASSVSVTGAARDIALNDLNVTLPGTNIATGSDIIIDTIAPTITSIISLTANGSYKEGANISIRINFSESITLTGTMGVNLDSGGVCVINAFSGTTATGVYTVQAGHSTLDLTATSVIVNTSARDIALNNLNTALPVTNISTNSNIVIDTTVPAITSITSSTTDGIYGVGANISIRINFSESITLTGTMGINLDSGGVCVINGFTGTTATGVYSVLVGHSSMDLAATSVSVNGTARDTASNDLNITLPGTNISAGSNIVIDTSAPTITSITSSTADGAYGVSSNISIRINFSESITLTGTLSVHLDSGGVCGISGFTGTTATGVYTVLAGQNSSDLTGASVSIIGTAQDTALNDLNISLPGTNIATGSNIIIDTSAPTITSITSSAADGAYGVGTNISIRINFSESITLIGTMGINLDSGGICIINGFTGTTATGVYSVLAGQNSSDLTATSIIVNTTARDAALNDLVLTLPGTNIASNSNIVIDTIEPTITSITSSTPDGIYSEGQSINVTLNFSESISVSTSLIVTLDSGGVVTIPAFTGITVSGTYTVLLGHNSADLTVSNISVVGTARDNALNDLNVALPGINIATGSEILVSTLPPSITSITSSNANGIYTAGETINVTVDFSNAITLVGTLTFNLDSGGSVLISSFNSATQASGTYTVLVGHSSNDLNVTSVAVNGTAKDIALADLILTLPSSNLANNKDIVVDGLNPTFASISSNTPNGYYSIGANINITIHFSKPVTLAGTLTLNLDSGGSVEFASFASATSAMGVYTVLDGHMSQDLDVVSASVDGTCKDAFLNDLNLAMPSNNLAVSSDIVVDTVGPVISSFQSISANGSYREGTTVDIIINFNEFVTTTGTISVNLSSGGIVNFGAFAGTNSVGVYTVLPGHNSAELNVTAVNLISGTILDNSSNMATLSVPSTNIGPISSIQIDTIVPTFVSHALAAGNVSVDIALSEGAYSTNLGTGALSVSNFNLLFAANGGAATNVQISSVSNTLGGALIGGESTIRILLSITDTVSGSETIKIDPVLNSIFDKAGNILSTTNTTGSILLFDQLGPSVVNVSSIAPVGSYKAGAVIPIRVKFTENVFVVGSPRLLLETGETDRLAVYVNGSGTSNLNFNYTVQSGDISSDLDYASTAALGLNGGALQDSFGNNATLLLPVVGGVGSLGHNNAITIDTTVPKIISASIGPNNAFVDISFSEPVYTTAGFGALDLSDFNLTFTKNGGTASGAVITELKTADNANLIGGETIIRAMITLTGLSSGKETISINAVTENIFDFAGNAMAVAESTGILALVDQGTVPVIQNISVVEGDGIYGVSKILTIAVKFSEVVTVTGIPYLVLETGLTDRLATFDNSVNNSDTIFLKYEIKFGDGTEKLEYVGSNSFVAGNNIKSLKGIPANVTLPFPGATGSISFNNNIKVETNKLIVTSISTTAPNGTYVTDMSIPLQINVSRPVELVGGKLLITLNSGAVLEVDQLIGDQINIDYKITDSDVTSLLNVTSLSLSLGATIKDVNGVNLDLSLPAISFSSLHQIEIKNSNPTLFVNASATEEGTITPSGKIAVKSGDKLDFVIQANSGFFIKQVLVNEISIGSEATYSLENIKENSSIHVIFAKIEGTYQLLANAGFGGGVFPSGLTEVPDGSDFKFTFFSDPGYHISNVRVNGVSLGAMNSYTFSNIQKDNQIFVSFAKTQSSYMISSNSIGRGKIIPEGHQNIPDGGDISFQIQPDPGYHIRRVLINGESHGRKSSVPFVNVIDNHTVTAVFEKTQSSYTITVNSIGKGSVTPIDSMVKVSPGGFAKFVFKPQAGSHVADVVVNGESKGPISQFEFHDVNEMNTLDVLFQETKEFYTVVSSVKNSSANSKIIFSNNSDVAHGKALAFTVTAEPGKKIINVKANGRFLYGENRESLRAKTLQTLGESASFILSPVLADTMIEADFVKNELEYLVNINTIGKGLASPQGAITIKKDESVGIVFTASEGHHLSDVIVDGSSIGPIQNLGLININNNKNILAIFSKSSSEYRINSSVTGKGSISPLGENIIAANGSMIFSITPETGYQLVDIKINGTSLPANSTNAKNTLYSFTNVIANHSIDAVFSNVSDNYTVVTSKIISGNFSGEESISVSAGSNYFLQVEQMNGYHISEVTINGVSIGSSSAYLISNISRDYSIIITYDEDSPSYKITSNKSKFGNVEPSDVIVLNAGENQVVEIKPINGYRVLDMKINGESKGAINSFLFKNVMQNQSIEVTYADISKPNSIKAEYFGAGDIYPEGLVAVGENGTVIFSIQEHRGSEIVDVKIDGVSHGAISSYTFIDVNSDHSIQAYFSEKSSSSLPNEEGDAVKLKGTGCQFALNSSHLNILELLLWLVFLFLLTILIKKKGIRRF